MEINYLKKYNKYYTKYKNIKKNILGGASNEAQIISLPLELNKESTNDTTIIRSFLAPDLKDTKYKYSKIEYEINDKKVYIIKIVLNEEVDKPVLFALAGMSHKSFLGTSNIIISKLDDLAIKFKEIYLLEYDSFKREQMIACQKRDELIQNAGMQNFELMSIDDLITKKQDRDGHGLIEFIGASAFDTMSLDDKLKNVFFEPELELNNKIAKIINFIIKDLKLSHIHLLGKCNGAWIATILITNETSPEIYKGLYLAVPGIPGSVEDLKKLDVNKLKDINFVFGWIKQDAYNFKWGKKSFEEKDRYDKIMQDIIDKNIDIDIKYHSHIYDNNCQAHPNIFHEIYPDMIESIIRTL
jgi:hypothetical protein